MRMGGNFKMRRPGNFAMRTDGRMVVRIGGRIDANMHFLRELTAGTARILALGQDYGSTGPQCLSLSIFVRKFLAEFSRRGVETLWRIGKERGWSISGVSI